MSINVKTVDGIKEVKSVAIKDGQGNIRMAGQGWVCVAVDYNGRPSKFKSVFKSHNNHASVKVAYVPVAEAETMGLINTPGNMSAVIQHPTNENKYLFIHRFKLTAEYTGEISWVYRVGIYDDVTKSIINQSVVNDNDYIPDSTDGNIDQLKPFVYEYEGEWFLTFYTGFVKWDGDGVNYGVSGPSFGLPSGTNFVDDTLKTSIRRIETTTTAGGWSGGPLQQTWRTDEYVLGEIFTGMRVFSITEEAVTYTGRKLFDPFSPVFEWYNKGHALQPGESLSQDVYPGGNGMVFKVRTYELNFPLPDVETGVQTYHDTLAHQSRSTTYGYLGPNGQLYPMNYNLLRNPFGYTVKLFPVVCNSTIESVRERLLGSQYVGRTNIQGNISYHNTHFVTMHHGSIRYGLIGNRYFRQEVNKELRDRLKETLKNSASEAFISDWGGWQGPTGTMAVTIVSATKSDLTNLNETAAGDYVGGAAATRSRAGWTQPFSYNGGYTFKTTVFDLKEAHDAFINGNNDRNVVPITNTVVKKTANFINPPSLINSDKPHLRKTRFLYQSAAGTWGLGVYRPGEEEWSIFMPPFDVSVDHAPPRYDTPGLPQLSYWPNTSGHMSYSAEDGYLLGVGERDKMFGPVAGHEKISVPFPGNGYVEFTWTDGDQIKINNYDIVGTLTPNGMGVSEPKDISSSATEAWPDLGIDVSGLSKITDPSIESRESHINWIQSRHESTTTFNFATEPHLVDTAQKITVALKTGLQSEYAVIITVDKSKTHL